MVVSYRRKKRRQSLQQEVSDLIRGASGGFLFGVPLLYTMEVWWIGSSVQAPAMLVAIAVTLIVVFALNLTAGFRQNANTSFQEAAGDAIVAVAIGLVCAAIMLVLLREITLQTQLKETLGKIIFESVPFSLGAALANQFLMPSDNGNGQNSNGSAARPNPVKGFLQKYHLRETFSDISAALTGALIVASSIAPTDEVPMLASGIQGPWLLGLVLASLVISYMIVFEANFTTQSQRHRQQGLFQRPLSETILAYLASLFAAGLMLAFFQQIDWSTPWELAFTYILVLGLPATIGGAAGRLAV